MTPTPTIPINYHILGLQPGVAPYMMAIAA